MWLRSEQRITYRRGRQTKKPGPGTAGANSRKTLGLSNSGRCQKISRCRRRSRNLLQEVVFPLV